MGTLPTLMETRARPEGEASLARLAREFERSRRFGHPLTLVTLAAGPGRDAKRLVGELTEQLRSVDQVWHDDGRIHVLLPETDRQAAVAVLGRLAGAGALPGDGLGVATFPDDALTIEATLHTAREPRELDALSA